MSMHSSLHKESRIYLLQQHSQLPVLQQLEHFQPWQQALVDGEAQLLSACLVTATVLLESELQFGICHNQHLIYSAFTHTNFFTLAKTKFDIHTHVHKTFFHTHWSAYLLIQTIYINLQITRDQNTIHSTRVNWPNDKILACIWMADNIGYVGLKVLG